MRRFWVGVALIVAGVAVVWLAPGEFDSGWRYVQTPDGLTLVRIEDKPEWCIVLCFVLFFAGVITWMIDTGKT